MQRRIQANDKSTQYDPRTTADDYTVAPLARRRVRRQLTKKLVRRAPQPPKCLLYERYEHPLPRVEAAFVVLIFSLLPTFAA